jgi:hypothetical protein
LGRNTTGNISKIPRMFDACYKRLNDTNSKIKNAVHAIKLVVGSDDVHHLMHPEHETDIKVTPSQPFLCKI